MKSTHRYYVVTQSRVPEGHATNDYSEAKRLLWGTLKIDPKAWICDNLEFGTWEPKR